MSRVVVVGGGLAGLTVAYWVAQAGAEVSLLEASPTLGGNCRTVRLEGVSLELGDGFFLSSPGTLTALCGQLGLPPAPWPSLPSIVRQGGRDWALPLGLNPSTGFGLYRITELPFSRATRWRLRTERFVGRTVKNESLGTFLRRRLGEEVWPVLKPYLEAWLGGPAEEVSVRLALGKLLELEGQGGLLAASRQVSHDGRLHLPSGMGSLIEALRQELQARAHLLTQQPAWAISRGVGRWQVHLREGRLEAEAVVVALPAPQAAKLLRPSAPQLTALLNHFPHHPSAKVFLLYPQEAVSAEPIEYFFARGEGYACTALRLLQAGPGLGLARAEFLGQTAHLGEAELARLAQQDLARRLQTPVRPLAAWVFRQPASRPQFGLQHTRWKDELERTLLYAPGLFFTGSYLAGPGLASLVEHGRQTAQRVLDFLALSVSQDNQTV
ncbi:protoporphyrinogen/coproporphyrinogen oxidase [Meiothermus rufus]|uniref:protoporphyrinogen/coproporphyrinogen oxidase n=1 Tax=Meiothermus rufus TaxID=604332 RepID=UPI00040154FD|nr:FAD-dependent oxidoreductase [Meiothermus rufus]